MTSWLYRVARRCAEHGWLVIAIWLVAATAIIGADKLMPGAAQDTFVLKGTDSATAQSLLNRAFPGSATEANPVVLYSPTLDFAAGQGAEIADDVGRSLKRLDPVTAVVTPEQNPDLLSPDEHTAIVSVTVSDRSAGKPETGEQVLDTAREAAGPGVQVALGGLLGRELSRPDTHLSEVLGLGAALIVLFLTLRRFSAMFIPLINAIMAVLLGLAVIDLLGRIVFIPETAPTLATMLGLGVGIDYALFLVTRHRVLLRQGFAVPDAVGRTAGTAGAGMVFAGGTLIAAVCGLTLTGISFLAWLGYAAAIVVLIAVLASITLVPAMLGVVKLRVLPKDKHDKHAATETEHREQLDRSGWARLAMAVTTKPWRYAIGSTLALLVLAAPTLTLTLGQSDASYLPPETTARQASDLIARGFGPGYNGPLAIVVQMYAPAQAPPGATEAAMNAGGSSVSAAASADPRTQDPRLTALRDDLAATPGIVRADPPVVSTDGGVAVIRTIPQWAPSNPQTEQLVAYLRTSVLPPATAGQGMAAHVGGVTALTTDLYGLITERTPWFILGVVCLSFVLLMLAYRSLLIPFKAAVMNLISIAAAYGVVTAVFQWGWGAQQLGLEGPVPIEAYVPMMMFAVLFGLSMDYEVFLLTAFREHWDRTGDMVTSVRRGLAETGKLVTSAALIMVVVFASFVLSDNSIVKMFGIGLSTAVIVDATIVRCLLVPAIMVLAAKGTWWLPDWLSRLLPQLHVEGDPVALDEVANAPRVPKPSARPLVTQRPLAVLGAVLGVALSWILVARIPGLAPEAGTAIAVSAVLGAVVVLLPPGLGGGRTTKVTRTLGFVIGVGLGLVVIAVLTAIIPPVKANGGTITSWAVVVIAFIVVLIVGRALALALILGAVSTAIALGVTAAELPSTAELIWVTLLPALLTALVTAAVMSLSSEHTVDAAGLDIEATPGAHVDRAPDPDPDPEPDPDPDPRTQPVTAQTTGPAGPGDQEHR